MAKGGLRRSEIDNPRIVAQEAERDATPREKWGFAISRFAVKRFEGRNALTSPAGLPPAQKPSPPAPLPRERGEKPRRASLPPLPVEGGRWERGAGGVRSGGGRLCRPPYPRNSPMTRSGSSGSLPRDTTYQAWSSLRPGRVAIPHFLENAPSASRNTVAPRPFPERKLSTAARSSWKFTVTTRARPPQRWATGLTRATMSRERGDQEAQRITIVTPRARSD